MGAKILYLSFLLGISLAYSGNSEYAFYIVSSYNTQVIGEDNIPTKAVELKSNTSKWQTLKSQIPRAAWIWDKNFDSNPSQICNFTEKFFVTGVPIVASLTIASDDNFEVFVNDIDSQCNGIFPNLITCDIISFLNPKENLLQITSKNTGGAISKTNLAGLIFSFKLVQQIQIRDSLT